MTLRVYLAAPLAQAPRAEVYSRMLTSRGYAVVSGWHSEVLRSGATVDPPHAETREAILVANVADLTRCSVMLALTDVGTPRGTLCEVGWALATDRRVVWLQGPDGAGANIFDSHPLVIRAHSTQEVMLALAALDRETPTLRPPRGRYGP